MVHYWRAMKGIVVRELSRFVTQRERFISALVRQHKEHVNASKAASWVQVETVCAQCAPCARQSRGSACA
jgi:hypothetical protein